MRQYAHGTLYDRLFTRPFLSRVQKKWDRVPAAARAERVPRARRSSTGTSSAKTCCSPREGGRSSRTSRRFKPGSLPADKPRGITRITSTRADEGGATVAPERFRDGGGDRTGGGATPAADVFSLGCVFGELFLDGAATFDYSQLLAYRRGEFDLRAALAPVGDDDVVDMIAEMWREGPGGATEREGVVSTRDRSAGVFFPAYFDALHDFCGGLLTADADEAAAEVRRAFDPLMAAIVEEEWRKDGGGPARLLPARRRRRGVSRRL